MDDDRQAVKHLEALVHDLAQQLQVIAMALAAVERRDGARHAAVLEPAKRALEKLDRGLEELAQIKRGGRSLRS